MAFLARRTDLSRRSSRQRDPIASADEAGESHTVELLGARSVRLAAGSGTAERIGTVAQLQRGFVSRGQLLEAGIDRHTIDRRIVSHGLLTVHRGVFAVAYRPAVYLGAETAALLAVRSGAVLSHRSAASVWGMLRPNPSGAVIHLTVPVAPSGHPEGVVVHRSRTLTPVDLRVHDSIPVTSPARVLLDLAAIESQRQLERALDEALIKRLVTVAAARGLVNRCGRHRGRAILGNLLEQHTTTTFTRSEAEECFLALIREPDLPQPLVNVRRHGYELDFLWPKQRLAVEIDGYRYHGGGGAFERDRRRDAVLKAAGIDTIRITWRQLQNEPIAVIARFARAFGAAPR